MKPSTQAHDASGFSLMEVLITVFITALASTIIVATAPKNDPAMEEEHERLKIALQNLPDNAIMSGNPRGLQFKTAGYVVVERRAEGWVQISDTMGQSAVLKPMSHNQTQSETDSPVSPHLMTDATGIFAPRRVELRVGDIRQELSITSEGIIETAETYGQ